MSPDEVSSSSCADSFSEFLREFQGDHSGGDVGLTKDEENQILPFVKKYGKEWIASAREEKRAVVQTLKFAHTAKETKTVNITVYPIGYFQVDMSGKRPQEPTIGGNKRVIKKDLYSFRGEELDRSEKVIKTNKESTLLAVQDEGKICDKMEALFKVSGKQPPYLTKCEFTKNAKGEPIIIEDRGHVDLFRYLSLNRDLSWDMRLKIAIALTRAVNSLHSANIVHRDIKAANFLIGINADGTPQLDKDGNVVLKLGDFDYAVDLNDETFEDSFKNYVGTHYYNAPEAYEMKLNGNTKEKKWARAKKEDSFSLGLLIAQVAGFAQVPRLGNYGCYDHCGGIIETAQNWKKEKVRKEYMHCCRAFLRDEGRKMKANPRSDPKVQAVEELILDATQMFNNRRLETDQILRRLQSLLEM